MATLVGNGKTAAGNGVSGPTTLGGRSPVVGRRRLEFYSWYLMRVSGLLLVVLAMGHFAIMHVFNSILDVDYHFAARRLALPAWRIYDWFLLALALMHGFNGLRIVVNEHVRPPAIRRAVQYGVAGAFAVFFALGTYVLVAFQPATG
jgi:succinate dehydrogenase / fumarate reductase, membrane anchor subunit